MQDVASLNALFDVYGGRTKVNRAEAIPAMLKCRNLNIFFFQVDDDAVVLRSHPPGENAAIE